MTNEPKKSLESASASAPQTLSPETLPLETLPLETLSPETLSPETLSSKIPSPKTSASVTSHDVARAAGVSQSAVSRAFSPDGKIAPATRARVLSAAKTLGYHPNAFARSLVQQRTRIVGVLVARLDNHFYPRVLEELTAGLWAAGRQVMYFNVDDSSDGGDGGGDLEGVLRTALQYRVEAMVLTSITLSSHLAETFYEAGVPVVLFNRRLDDPNVHAVACDNEGGGRLVADALLDAGHKRFAFVGGHPDTSTNQDRKAGFSAGLRARGAGLAVALEKDYSYDWGRSAVRGLFSQPEPPDALFCAGDLIALGALDALRVDLGVRVPEEVAVVGFDDVAAASWGSFELSTVRQPVDRLVRETLAVVTGAADAPPRRVTVPVTFVPRGTTRPAVPAAQALLTETVP